MTATAAEPARFTIGDRAGDRLLNMEEIVALTKRAPGTLRWLRHIGKIPPLFNSYGRLFAWESEILAWLEQEQANDAAAAASSA